MIDDVSMTEGSSVALALGLALTAGLLYPMTLDQYRAGGSALWIAGGIRLVLSAILTLVRDVRDFRRRPRS